VEQETTYADENSHGTVSEEGRGQRTSRAQQDPSCVPMNSVINRNNPLWESVGRICPIAGKSGMILVPKISSLIQSSLL